MRELNGDYVKCLPVEIHVTSYTIPSFCAFGKTRAYRFTIY